MSQKTQQPPPQPEDQITLKTLDALKVYFDPLRIRIVQEMANEPRTVQQVAEALEVPFTRLYYHINLLEKNGIIRVVDIRAMSGAVEEKYYQVAARMLVVDRSLLTLSPEDPEQSGLEVFMRAMLDATRDDIRKSAQQGLINLDEDPPNPDSLLLRRGALRMSPERATRFYKDLVALVRQYQEEESNPEDTYYGVLLSVYPTILPYSDPDSEDEPS